MGIHGKVRLKAWLVLVLVPTILVVAFVVYRLCGASALQKQIEALSAASYPVTLAELDQWYATPATGQNAADYVTAAISYLRDPTAQEKEHLPSFTSDRLWPRTEALDEKTLDLIARFVDRNQQAIELLEDAAALPSSRFPIDLTQGHRTLINHVSEFRKIAHLFNLKAMSQAQRGRPDLATDTVITALGVVDSLVDEPLLISQMVRRRCQYEIVTTTEWVVNQTTLEEENLIRLQKALAEAYDPNGLIRGFIGQQCMTIHLLQYPRESGLDLDLGELGDAPSLLQIRVAQVTGRADRYLVELIDLTQRCITTMHMPPAKRLAEARAIEAETDRLPKTHKRLRHFMPRFDEWTFILDVRNLAQLRAATTAMAVERYRLGHGVLPDRLDALVPAFLDAVPQDPFDGQPLRYKKLATGYVIYSVNDDGHDDGGRQRPPREERSDPPADYDITFTVER